MIAVILVKGIYVLPNIDARQITVAEMAPHVHSFGMNENKVEKISNWLIDWIKLNLASGKIKPYDMLPPKGDLAFHIGVSKGTMQNVFRCVEDRGFVESKQRIGTFIKPSGYVSEKLTSKREIAAAAVKKYLKQNNYQPGDKIVSTRQLSQIIGFSNTTIRIAFTSLISENILEKKGNVFVVRCINFETDELKQATLADKVADKIKQYVKNDFSAGDKLPTNGELAKRFNVSIKTIHDSMKLLIKEGILSSRRGRYGTIVAGDGEKTELYNYEKIELKIRQYIHDNCEVGAKLPTIAEFSEIFKMSQKTIKRALNNLSEDGYLTFVRGRYGGTFVTDIPQDIYEAYKWLALSSDYVSILEN